MNNIVFNQILHLVSCGYTVEFSKVDTHASRQVLRIELRDGEHRHVEFVDMAVAASSNIYDSAQANADYVISKTLSIARDELDYYIKNLEENE